MIKLRRRYPAFVDGPSAPEEYEVHSLEELNNIDFIKERWLTMEDFSHFVHSNDLLLVITTTGRHWAIAWVIEGCLSELNIPRWNES